MADYILKFSTHKIRNPNAWTLCMCIMCFIKSNAMWWWTTPLQVVISFKLRSKDM